MAHTYCSLEEAVSLLLAQFSPSPCTEEVPLSQALNRVCAGDITAPVDHPPFDRSPLDGYAARSEDLDGASPSSPAVLDVRQRIYAGQVPAGPVQPGTCARIMTGAPIPPGADCVIRREDTDYGENQVRIFASSAPHRNICDRGEDLRKGAPILSRGTLLTPAHLGVLAGTGSPSLPLWRWACWPQGMNWCPPEFLCRREKFTTATEPISPPALISWGCALWWRTGGRTSWTYSPPLWRPCWTGAAP